LERAVKRIGVVANTTKTSATQVLYRLARKAKAVGVTLVTTRDVAALLPDAQVCEESALAGGVDVLMALGGDGTMLHTIRLRGEASTPVIGVNMGSLGFMTSVTLDDMERAVDVLVQETYLQSSRVMLQCRVLRGERVVSASLALNDMVVGWGASSRAVTLGLEINGEPVSSYLCDGLIVCTPTGSTGHSLSAWGPVIHPDAPVLLVNVVCPHTLSARPLILSDRSKVTVRVLDLPESKQLLLSADGQGDWTLAPGDVVQVERVEEPVHFLHLPEYSYFNVLRQKLHWRGSVQPDGSARS